MKVKWKKTFFVDFLQTAKVFPTNFISAILSTNIAICKKLFFVLVKSKTSKIFPTL